ncbi:uncharacterized protein LOC135271280 [Aotus nancymaae]|uniref:uncharacterized protein LOC135271280 n=1 Tax=Aotus nancymaae TaxID=37293 RepID=UPI0030FE88A4
MQVTVALVPGDGSEEQGGQVSGVGLVGLTVAPRPEVLEAPGLKNPGTIPGPSVCSHANGRHLPVPGCARHLRCAPCPGVQGISNLPHAQLYKASPSAPCPAVQGISNLPHARLYKASPSAPCPAVQGIPICPVPGCTRHLRSAPCLAVQGIPICPVPGCTRHLRSAPCPAVQGIPICPQQHSLKKQITQARGSFTRFQVLLQSGIAQQGSSLRQNLAWPPWQWTWALPSWAVPDLVQTLGPTLALAPRCVSVHCSPQRAACLLLAANVCRSRVFLVLTFFTSSHITNIWSRENSRSQHGSQHCLEHKLVFS